MSTVRQSTLPGTRPTVGSSRTHMGLETPEAGGRARRQGQENSRNGPTFHEIDVLPNGVSPSLVPFIEPDPSPVIKQGVGWAHRGQPKGAKYYEVGNKREMAWRSLDSRSGTSQAQQYLNEVIAMAQEARVPWPAGEPKLSTRTNILSGGLVDSWDSYPRKTPHRLLEMTRGMRRDEIIVIENITSEWIGELGSQWGLPPEFFVLHAADPRHSDLWDRGQGRIMGIISRVNGALERTQALKAALARLRVSEQSESNKAPRLEGDLRESRAFIDRLQGKLEDAKTILEGCGPYEAPLSSLRGWPLERRWILKVDAFLNVCNTVLDKSESNLKPNDSFSSGIYDRPYQAEPELEHELEKALSDFEQSVASRFHNLAGTFEYPDHRFRESPLLPTESTLFFSRSIFPPDRQDPLRSTTRISYIRAKKNICLVLVDLPMPRSMIYPRRPGRSRINLRMSQVFSRNNAMVLPQLFEISEHRLSEHRLFESMVQLERSRWHAHVLCSDHFLLGAHMRNRVSSNNRSGVDSQFAAIGPRPLLFLLSSSLWGANLKYLENEIKRISFNELRDPKMATNVILHNHREDLVSLKEDVSEAQAQLSDGLSTFYAKLPIIKARDELTQALPEKNFKRVLSRAKELEDFLMDSFQLLMSSVSLKDNQFSIEQASYSIQQSSRANMITLLAFIYVPLTLVTGVFGMNITQAQDGFEWWAPIVALVIAAICTYLLYELVRRWNKRREAKVRRWNKRREAKAVEV